MSIMSDAKSYYNYLQTITDKNNAESSKQADKMMAFQREMSDTAHQREVADLKAAGLNPVLSAGGQGASSPQGAMGQTDMSAASALTQYLGSLINQQTAISVAQINAGAAKYAADMNYKIQQDFPNSWAGLVTRLIDDLGLRSLVRDYGQTAVVNGVAKLFGVSKNSSITPGSVISTYQGWNDIRKHSFFSNLKNYLKTLAQNKGFKFY